MQCFIQQEKVLANPLSFPFFLCSLIHLCVAFFQFNCYDIINSHNDISAHRTITKSQHQHAICHWTQKQWPRSQVRIPPHFHSWFFIYFNSFASTPFTAMMISWPTGTIKRSQHQCPVRHWKQKQQHSLAQLPQLCDTSISMGAIEELDAMILVIKHIIVGIIGHTLVINKIYASMHIHASSQQTC
jgi:hypothetical protein